MKTKPQLGNCFFATLYLMLRGKVDRIIAVSSESRWWPHHYLVINKKGHVLHFQHTKPHMKNAFAPWWFEGQFVGIRASVQEEVLKRSGRSVVRTIDNVWLGMSVFILIWGVLMLPWILAWSLFTPVWAAAWGIHALRKRRRFLC